MLQAITENLKFVHTYMNHPHIYIYILIACQKNSNRNEEKKNKILSCISEKRRSKYQAICALKAAAYIHIRTHRQPLHSVYLMTALIADTERLRIRTARLQIQRTNWPQFDADSHAGERAEKLNEKKWEMQSFYNF